MKKTAKILTLVLSLAILCGALAISAFASDEIIGVKTHFKTDFTGGKSLGINDGTVVPEFTVDNKGSGVSNVVWDPTGGNWYFSWSYEENVGTATGNYSYTAPKPGHSWVDPNNSQVDIFEDYYWKNNKYYIFDVDIWFPKEVPGSRVTIYFLNYYVDQTEKDGTMMVGDSTESKSGINWTFTNSPSGNPLVSAGYGPKHDIFDGTWNHITGIISSEVVDNSVVLTCHTALNGTIIDVYTYTLGADAASSNNAYEGDWTLWYPKTVRIDYGGNDMNGNIVNIDNMSIRTIENHYNGNLDQVLKGGVGTKTSAWESDLYDEYNMPFSKPVAYIGTTPFDHLQKAIDAADEGAVITLAANVKSNVTINKHITIECGEFTMAPPATAPGLVYEYDPQTNVYTIANTQDVLYITWEGCVCPLCEAAGTPDPTHPGGIDAEGYLNNKISQYYEDAGKSTSWTLTNDISTYRLIGWMDDNGNVYDLDAVITQEMIDSVLLTLTPVIDVETVPIAYIKGGKTYYVTNIASAVSAADEGTTITFLDDVKLGKESSLNVTKNITIDLNGYCFDIMTSQKFSAIVVNGEKSLTITSSRPGGSILRAYPTAETKWGGTLFTTSGKDSVITLKGIKVSTAALYGNWSNLTVTLNIEDCYMNADGAGDNPSFVYHKGILTANIKNSLFKGSNNNFGINVADEGSVINAENSIFINNIVDGTYNNCTVNLKGCYISGSIAARKINIDKGCRFTENAWASKANFASGVTLTERKFEINHINYTHPWVVNTVDGALVWDNEASKVFTEVEIARTYWYETVGGVTVTFKDGDTVLGTAVGEPGQKVIGPDVGAPESVADGWVLVYKTYAYTVCATDGDEVTVDVKDITEFEYRYDAGAPKLYINYRLSDNLTTNLYAPQVLPEGITITATALSSSSTARTWSGNYTINGEKYHMTQCWPSAWNADDGSPYWTITYTYNDAIISYVIQPSVMDYARKVIDIYANDTEKIRQLTALLQYVEAANILKKQTPASELTAILKELKAKVTLPTIPEATGNTDALAPYISGFKITVNANRGGAFMLTLTDAAKAAGVSVKVSAKGTTVPTSVSNGAVYSDDCSLTTWGASELTIEIRNETGVIATGTYSMAAYNTEFASQATDAERSMIVAIYALAYIGYTN